MIKAVKKLKKFWPRKKRRKKSYQEPYYYVPPPPPQTRPPPCHCCSYSAPVQPSAPPLPPWLEPEQIHETISVAETQQLPGVGYQSQIQFPSQEMVEETNPTHPTLPVHTTLTYQQYTVPNPVFGVPIVEQKPTKERSAGFFGCFVKFGANLIRCFCPCLHIREVD